MKHRKRTAMALVFLSSFLLAGCGTPMYDLTDEERDLIVSYSADVLAKYNIYQKDGIQVVDQSLLEFDTQEEETETQSTEAEPSEEEFNSGQGGEIPEEAAGGAITIGQALGLPESVGICYTGYTTSDYYTEGNAYSLSASSGKVYLIASFTLTATQDTELDILSQNPRFSLNLGEDKITQELTYLTTDLSTYIGSLTAGQEENLVILFEIPADAAADLGDPQFSVTVNGQTNLIKL